MASTITPATLTVTVTEAVTLNGYDQGSSNSFTVADVNEVVKRIVTISTTETGLIAFTDDGISAVGTPQHSYVAGQFDADHVRYIRIPNKDDSNLVMLTFRGATSGAEFAVKVDALGVFMYCCDMAGGVDATMDAHSTAQTHSLENLLDITADADTASCDLEVFVASI